MYCAMFQNLSHTNKSNHMPKNFRQRVFGVEGEENDD